MRWRGERRRSEDVGRGEEMEQRVCGYGRAGAVFSKVWSGQSSDFEGFDERVG